MNIGISLHKESNWVTQKLYFSRIYDVKEFKLHPDYDNEWVVYDYAVIRLKRDIKFTPIVNAACLPRYLLWITRFVLLSFIWHLTNCKKTISFWQRFLKKDSFRLVLIWLKIQSSSLSRDKNYIVTSLFEFLWRI